MGNIMTTQFARRLVVAAFFVAFAAGKGHEAVAQDTEGNDSRVMTIEEIVVTARKRDERLRDIPAAITAIPESTIREQNLTSITDFVQLIPTGFVDEGVFGLDDRVSLRGTGGIGLDFFEQATGIYRDGYYIGGTRTVFSDMIDLERVEVLRGPQGGLYGRNAVGGAVNFIYKRPDLNEVGGEAEVSYGEFDRIEGRGVINIPVVEDQFAFRVASWYVNQEEGEYFNITRDEYVDAEQSFGIRAKALWQVNDTVDIEAQLEWNDEDAYENVGAFDSQSGSETKTTVERDTESDADREWLFAGTTVNVDTRFGLLTGQLSAREYELKSLADQDFTPVHAQEITRDETVDSLYGEIRLATPADNRISGVTGITVFNEDVGLQRRTTAFDPTNNPFGFSEGDHEIDTASYALWADVTFALTDSVEAWISGRYTDEEKTLDFDQNVTVGALLDFEASGLKNDFTNTSFGAGVSWKISDDAMVYARVAEGFRAGGFNTLLTIFADPVVGGASDEEIAEFLKYEDETSINYELGAKTAWLDDRLLVDIAVFRLEQEDLLQGDFEPGTFVFIFKNGGSATTDGVELEITARPLEQMTVTGSLGYLDGELDETGPFGATEINGGKATTATFGASYRIPLGSASTIRLNGDWRYRNDRGTFGLVDGESPLEYSIFDAGIALERDQWDVSLLVNNLTDDDYIISGAFPVFPGPPVVTRADGRSWSIRFRRAF